MARDRSPRVGGAVGGVTRAITHAICRVGGHDVVTRRRESAVMARAPRAVGYQTSSEGTTNCRDDEASRPKRQKAKQMDNCEHDDALVLTPTTRATGFAQTRRSSMRLALASLLGSYLSRALLTRARRPSPCQSQAAAAFLRTSQMAAGPLTMRPGRAFLTARSATKDFTKPAARFTPVPKRVVGKVTRGVVGRGLVTTNASGDAKSDSSSSSSSQILPERLTWPARSHGAGTLRSAKIGQTITLCGWIDKQRDMGGLTFCDVRDHTGLAQIVGDDDTPAEARNLLSAVRAEWVVAVTGVVRERKDKNSRIPTGDVELLVTNVQVLNTVGKSLPFQISGDGDDDKTSEEVRLKNRVLDLRRPSMTANLQLRAKTIKNLRNVLENSNWDFMEVETPILTRSTPEGARDYLVPSRLQPGSCYALPQSPQLFKQMLMVAGVDRYYQVARCFRDEDLRSDRQPEFTQLDIEMAFTDMDGILELGEDLMCAAFEGGIGVELPRPFLRMTYADAMTKYGSDKPDLRYGLEMCVLNELLRGSEFKLFADAIESGGVVKALAVPEGDKISNSKLKPKGDVFNEAVKGGAGGLAFVRVGADGLTLDGGKALCEALQPVSEQLVKNVPDAGPGSLILFGVGDEPSTNKALDRVRQYIAKEVLHLVPCASEDKAGHEDGGNRNHHAALWITEFPMFETNHDENRLEALHHPFTAPNQDDVVDGGDITKARAVAYDLVYNGVEVGGGSLRIYRRDVQEKVFDAIGLSKKDAEEKFGYLMDAFQFGAPPHGGMAFGVDRLVMLLAGAKSIRDVIAFPKTATATCLLTQAPGTVTDAQLKDLHVAKLKSEKNPLGEDEK